MNLSALNQASAEPIYAGIVIFQDRENTLPLEFNAGAEGAINGLIYAKRAGVTVTGGANLLKAQLVVGWITLSGGSVIGEPDVWLNIGPGSGTATAVAWADR